ESVPMDHTDIDSSLIAKLPIQSVGQGVTDMLSLTVPGITKDSDGYIHPAGDHAETQYSFDNQPVTNQQNKQASNQMPLNAVQSFEAITGAPPPEFGDKASLVDRRHQVRPECPEALWCIQRHLRIVRNYWREL